MSEQRFRAQATAEVAEHVGISKVTSYMINQRELILKLREMLEKACANNNNDGDWRKQAEQLLEEVRGE